MEQGGALVAPRHGRQEVQMRRRLLRAGLAAVLVTFAGSGCEKHEAPAAEPVLERTSPAHTPPSRRVRIALHAVPLAVPGAVVATPLA
jgi:hypothetical protein